MRQLTKEEYIEVIFALESGGQRVQTGQIAERMQVKPPSVTEMLGKLSEEGLVDYEPYAGARLTPEGREMAEELMARHRAIADFLEIIGIDRETAERDACQIEHHVSPESARMLEKFVGFIQGAPRDPRWIERFREYCRTGERQECE